MPSAPSVPLYVLRHHSAQINALCFVLPAAPSPSRSRRSLLCSGDADGWVAITDLRSRRALCVWRAHEDGVLGIEEWEGDKVITSGRDNKLHIWELPAELPSLGRLSASASGPPKLRSSMDVNALNYCRFSLLPSITQPGEAWIAMPNLTDSETIDIFHLPSQLRPHAAIGFSFSYDGSALGRGAGTPDATGLVMSLHLVDRTSLIAGYESGHVVLYSYEGPPEGVTDARLPDVGGSSLKTGRGRWVQKWKVKGHTEAVMCLAVSPTGDFALSCSAEHLVVKYLLAEDTGGQPRSQTFKTTQVGNASISMNVAGRVCAVGGWDGSVRLYSTKTFKSLGQLDYHRDTCHVVAFPSLARPGPPPEEDPEHQEEEEESDSEDEGQALPMLERWMVSGGLDGRVGVWELMDFEKKGG